jgi:DNA-directed RNA polymerase II subunit RPB2
MADKSNEIITTDDIFKLIDLYFNQKYVIYQHLFNSYDKFLDSDVYSFLKEGNNTFYEHTAGSKVYRYKFVFDTIQIAPPTHERKPLFPSVARNNNLNYISNISATITQVQEIEDIMSGEIERRVIGEPEQNFPITSIPTMVRSKYCNTTLRKGGDKDDSETDPGGYFIIGGAEKVIIGREAMIQNKPLVFHKKESTFETYYVQLNSQSYKNHEMNQMLTIRLKNNETMILKVPLLKEVPIFTIFKALGIESNKTITDICVYNKNDHDMINLVQKSLEDCKDMNGNKIMTRDDALNYLVNNLRVIGSYSTTDKELKEMQRKMHLVTLLEKNFIPHIQGTSSHKAYYLGYMVNKLLSCHLGRMEKDDRDSFINKRIDLPGSLIFELFKQLYKKMLNECKKHFKKKNTDDINPINVIRQIKSNIIEQGIKTAMLTGNWNKKKGVAQMLQRSSYANTIASLRRLNSPMSDTSIKLTGPRHLHPSGLSAVCSVETPEGGSVGNVKHLSMVGYITVMMKSQIKLINNLLSGRLIDELNVPTNKLGEYIKVFLNGEPIGLTDEPNELYEYMKSKKIDGTLEKHTSITFDIESVMKLPEIKIYCDGGRLITPKFRVNYKTNELYLKKQHIDMISLDSNNSSEISITSWNQFLLKNRGVIEYVDTDELYCSIVAMYPWQVKKMQRKMLQSINNVSKLDISSNYEILNRYDDDYTFIKYSYCEIHPSLLLGAIASNIPFCNHNQSPRNVYYYSQARHAMGIYIGNYRSRLDTSGYILYHTHNPLVITRSAKYTEIDKLPAGENVIVSVGLYTGYNMEDSVILNKSSVERGLFCSTNLDRFTAEIQTNPNTSDKDLFVKPVKETTVGIKDGSYDKLNEKGIAPEETEIEYGDVLIGKITPINPTGKSNKTHKDGSVVYKKSHVPAVVDKVWPKIHNVDGYEIKKMRLRSLRIPQVGDKFCSRNGQKGLCGILLPSSELPFTKNGLQPDIIMNAHAIPSRMTIGYLLELLSGKVGALRGHLVDATPFLNPDTESIKQILKSLGFRNDGTEYMMSGITGEQMDVAFFIGPMYYMRLKQMANDKIHSRARGPRTGLTMQAPEGRARDGGLRIGNMEKDSQIAHGMASFLKERFMETADLYEVHICSICGLFAQRMLRRDHKPYKTKHDIYFCNSCKNKTKISKVRMPYAFKLLLQELMAMNIAPRIRTVDDIYHG